ELVQDVDVGAYAARIAAGEQIFEFSGAVRTADEASPDVARIVAEYRDLHNHLVLEAFDSGEILSYEWHPVSDVRVAPAGTGWIRLRLISTRFSEGANDGYFDALSLRSLRAPTVVIDDVLVYEGHSGLTDSVFTVDLACAYEHPISVDYHTADGTALAGEDYLVTAGTLDFPPGATTAPVTVPVLAD
ncbi:MAG: hypothetical protein GY856_50195, partial [bacterium]|nr:hypothetical protein [bacterium]